MTRAEWKELETLDREKHKRWYQYLLEQTEKEDEHPEGYNGPCLCQVCMSCRDS